MKITDLKLTLFSWDDLPGLKYSAHNPQLPPSSDLGLVEIVTDDGVTGHSFLGSSFRPAHLDAVSLVEVLKPIVIGKNPLDRGELYHQLSQRWRATTWRAIGAVDIALWDIVGKVAGLPVHRMLGTTRTKIAAYASSGTLASSDLYVEQALAVIEKGFTGYKLHPPLDLRACVDVCVAVRKAVGPDVKLMIDPTGAYDFPAAVYLGRAIEDLGFYWYEDPLAEDDIYNYTKLREKLDIPIMATEYAHGSFHSYAAWITARATDYLRGDVAVKGGLTPIIKSAHLADAFKMNYEIHHGGNSFNNCANLHVQMAIRNCEFFEVLLPDQAQKYGVINDLDVDAQGFVHAIEEPGIGVDIDVDLIRSKTIKVLS
jgi:L-alanine-DL-glutamate epimerase-like enolase superfamily enzyme